MPFVKRSVSWHWEPVSGPLPEPGESSSSCVTFHQSIFVLSSIHYEHFPCFSLSFQVIILHTFFISTICCRSQSPSRDSFHVWWCVLNLSVLIIQFCVTRTISECSHYSILCDAYYLWVFSLFNFVWRVLSLSVLIIQFCPFVVFLSSTTSYCVDSHVLSDTCIPFSSLKLRDDILTHTSKQLNVAYNAVYFNLHST